MSDAGLADVRLVTEGIAVRRLGRAKRLAWLAFGFFAAIALLSPLVGAAVSLAGLLGAAASGWALARLHLAHPLSDPRGMAPGALALTDTRVVVEQRGTASFECAREKIAEGWIEPFTGLATVVLRMRNHDLVAFWVRDIDEARGALRAAGVSPAQQAFRMRLASDASQHRFGRTLAIVLVAALAPCGILNALAFVLRSLEGLAGGDFRMVLPFVLSVFISALIAVALYQVAKFMAPPSVVVGTDGIALAGVGKRRFIPLAAIERESADGSIVSLSLATGEAVRLSGRSAEAADVLLERIREALKASRAGDRSAARVEELDRNGRSFVDWLGFARELLRSPDYRNAGLDAENLADVVEDAANPPERRIAAAVALSRSDDERAKERVRIAVQACAHEPLRIAIDHAIEGEVDEAEVERAAFAPASRTPRRA